MPISMADVDPDDDSIFDGGIFDENFGLQFRDAVGHEFFIVRDEAEEVIVAEPSEVVDRLLSVDFHFSGVFKMFGEGSAEDMS